MKSRNWFLARFPRSIASLFSRRTETTGRRRARPTLAPFDKLEERLAFSVGYATVNDWGSGLRGRAWRNPMPSGGSVLRRFRPPMRRWSTR